MGSRDTSVRSRAPTAYKGRELIATSLPDWRLVTLSNR
jgi:hypothetical protein